MQIKSIRSVLRMATLAFVAVSLFELPAGAQSPRPTDETTVVGESTLVGLARGEMMRFTSFNPRETESGRRNASIRMRLRLFNPDGTALIESSELEIPPGEFRSINFNRDELLVAGEPGTGRAQIRTVALWSCRYSGRYVINTSLEIVDNTGATRSVATGHIKVFDGSSLSEGTSNTVTSGGRATQEYLIGMVPGQTLRFNVFNSLTQPASQDAPLQRVGSRLLIIKADSSYIHVGDEVTIPAGEFRSFDFNRSSVNVPGEPVTGRVQVRVVVEGTFTLTFSGQTTTVPLSTSWELIDNATGQTEVSCPSTCNWYIKNSNG